MASRVSMLAARMRPSTMDGTRLAPVLTQGDCTRGVFHGGAGFMGKALATSATVAKIR